MTVCFEYIGPVRWWDLLSTETQAAWMGVMVAVAALLATVVIWFIDRWRERRLRKDELQAQKRDQERAAQIALAHNLNAAARQAMLLLPTIVDVRQRMTSLTGAMKKRGKMSDLSAAEGRCLNIPEIDRLAATDTSVFPVEIEGPLVTLIALIFRLDAIRRQSTEVVALNNVCVEPEAHEPLLKTAVEIQSTADRVIKQLHHLLNTRIPSARATH